MALDRTQRYAAMAVMAAGLATFAAPASAQLTDTATGNVSVVVDNTITITETTAMSFGTVAAVADAAQTASIVLSTAGTATPGTTGGAAVFYLDTTTTPSQGIFAVEGPNGATITVTPPAAPVAVNCPTGIDFTLDTFTDDSGGSVLGLGTGTPITVNVGATLKSDSTVGSATAYDSVTCTGTYIMTIGL